MKYVKLWETFKHSPYDLDKMAKAKSDGDTWSEVIIGEIDGHTLVYQTYSKMMGGNGINGTIRTAPQNYYVATISDDGDIVFDDLESMTRSINKEKVTELYYNYKIANSNEV